MLLPSLYASLNSIPRHHTFVFVAFTSEEHGLVGSRFYVKELGAERLSKLTAMVNMDSLGMSSTKVATSHADRGLLAALSTVARSIQVSLQEVNFDKIGRTDSKNFDERHIPIIDVHSLTQDIFGCSIRIKINFRRSI